MRGSAHLCNHKHFTPLKEFSLFSHLIVHLLSRSGKDSDMIAHGLIFTSVLLYWFFFPIINKSEKEILDF